LVETASPGVLPSETMSPVSSPIASPTALSETGAHTGSGPSVSATSRVLPSPGPETSLAPPAAEATPTESSVEPSGSAATARGPSMSTPSITRAPGGLASDDPRQMWVPAVLLLLMAVIVLARKRE
jgi:hypothetical protein